MSADKRVETGPVVFGNDWTGLFIRGNDAFDFVKSIEAALKTFKVTTTEDAIHLGTLRALVKLLKMTDEQIKTDRTVPKYYEMPKEKQ